MNSSITILIVDDDEDDREFLIEAFSLNDDTIHCIEAVNGYAALEFLANTERILPDYIFLDLNMPRITGKQCLEEIKRNNRAKNIPVIIYSTGMSDREVKETTELGAVYFMKKPATFAKLCQELGFLITKKFK